MKKKEKWKKEGSSAVYAFASLLVHRRWEMLVGSGRIVYEYVRTCRMHPNVKLMFEPPESVEKTDIFLLNLRTEYTTVDL